MNQPTTKAPQTVIQQYPARAVKELKQENALLRKALELDEAPFTLEMWEQSGTQAMRDGFAARALLQEWGNQPHALQRLGFNVINKAGQWKPAHVAMLADKVLNTPGVRAQLDHNLKEVDASWEKVVERQRSIALTGTDENAIRAAQNLAKFETRIKDAPPAQTSVSLHVLVNGEAATATAIKTIEHDPLALLAHEPSDDGVAIDTTGDLEKDG